MKVKLFLVSSDVTGLLQMAQSIMHWALLQKLYCCTLCNSKSSKLLTIPVGQRCWGLEARLVSSENFGLDLGLERSASFNITANE